MGHRARCAPRKGVRGSESRSYARGVERVRSSVRVRVAVPRHRVALTIARRIVGCFAHAIRDDGRDATAKATSSASETKIDQTLDAPARSRVRPARDRNSITETIQEVIAGPILRADPKAGYLCYQVVCRPPFVNFRLMRRRVRDFDITTVDVGTRRDGTLVFPST